MAPRRLRGAPARRLLSAPHRRLRVLERYERRRRAELILAILELSFYLHFQLKGVHLRCLIVTL